MHQHQKYFDLLGIPPTTDLSKIKKAYRKKALLCHPDKNKSPNAEQKFIELTEAYDFLIGNQSTTTSYTESTKTADQVRAEKIRQAKERYRKMQNDEVQKDAEYYARISEGWRWNLFRNLAIYTAIFTVLLTADFFFTRSHRAIPEVTVYGHIPQTITQDDELFILPKIDYWVGEFPPVQLNYSLFFNDLKSINILDQPVFLRELEHPADKMIRYELFKNFPSTEYYAYASIYNAFPFFHLIMLFPLFMVWYKRPSFNFTLGRILCIWAIFPVVIFLTFSGGRIFGLFGFV